MPLCFGDCKERANKRSYHSQPSPRDYVNEGMEWRARQTLSVTCPSAQHLEGQKAGTGRCEKVEKGERDGDVEPRALDPWTSFHPVVLSWRQFCPQGTLGKV